MAIFPKASTPWTWNTFFARSRPIVVTSFIGRLSSLVTGQNNHGAIDAAGWEPSISFLTDIRDAESNVCLQPRPNIGLGAGYRFSRSNTVGNNARYNASEQIVSAESLTASPKWRKESAEGLGEPLICQALDQGADFAADPAK